MRLIIIEHNHDIHKIIENPEFIPRVGDHIDLGYRPISFVELITWNYDENSVCIIMR